MNDSGLVDHCLELLSPLGSTSTKRMFSGNALYIDGLCVALIIGDTLYLKVDDTSRPLFEAAGCKPFTYGTKNGERSALSYYTAPDEAMESPHEMIPWARRALTAAVAARAKSPPKKKAARKTAAAKKTATAKPATKPVAKKAAPVAKAPAPKVPLARQTSAAKPAAAATPRPAARRRTTTP